MNNQENVNTPNRAGDTPLHLAVENGDVEIAKLLINAGASAFVPNRDGDTALHLAIGNRDVEMVKSLTARPAVSAVSADGAPSQDKKTLVQRIGEHWLVLLIMLAAAIITIVTALL